MTTHSELLVDQLAAMIHLLPVKDHDFANSLVAGFRKYGKLSDKQWYWVDKLLEKAANSTEQHSSTVEEVFDGTELMRHFIQAAKTLKFPKLRVLSDTGAAVLFYRAGELSKEVGTIRITNGRNYPQRVIYGVISLGGEGRIARSTPIDIKQLIRKVAAKPSEELKANGIKFNTCCFCGHELLNKISVFHGYGPVCADKWGLPWEGSREETEAAKAKEIRLVDLAGESEVLDIESKQR